MLGLRSGITTSGRDVPGEGVDVTFGGATIGTMLLGSQGVVDLVCLEP